MARPLEDYKLSPLGHQLHALIVARGYDNWKAATVATGLSYDQLLDVACGRIDPKVSTLLKIVGALGGTMGDLFPPPAPARSRSKKRA